MTTYSISLDDDVAPAHTQRHNALMKEHFELQVLQKDVVEEPIFYTCHICDIQVPTAFASEHRASIKHRANANIASVAASRLRAFAVALPPLPPSTSHPMAFCTNCSTIVDEKHHETKGHTVAVMNDNLLWNLMNAYVKNDIDGLKGLAKMGNRNAKTDNDQITKDYSNARDVDSNDKKGDNSDGNGELVTENSATYIFIDSSLKQYFNSSSKVVGNSNKETVVVPTSSRGFRSLTKAKEVLKEESSISKQNYAKQLSDKHANDSYIELLCKVNNMDYSQSGLKELGGEILIRKWNEIIRVPADHFHSIIYDKCGNAVCVLCKAKFHADDAETHKYEIIHMNQVVNVCDSHGIRKVQFGTRHCVICNLKLKRKAADAHVKSREHVEKKNLCTQTISDMTNEEKLKRVVCNQNENGSKDQIEKKDLYNETETDTTNEEKLERVAGNQNVNGSKDKLENKILYTEKVTDTTNEEKLTRVACNQNENGSKDKIEKKNLYTETDTDTTNEEKLERVAWNRNENGSKDEIEKKNL